MLGNYWFLRRVMRKLVVKYNNEILMGRYIMKQPLYRVMSWWFRCSREEAQEVLKLIEKAYEGVVFSNRGLYIPRAYLDPRRGVLSWPADSTADRHAGGKGERTPWEEVSSASAAPSGAGPQAGGRSERSPLGQASGGSEAPL